MRHKLFGFLLALGMMLALPVLAFAATTPISVPSSVALAQATATPDAMMMDHGTPTADSMMHDGTMTPAAMMNEGTATPAAMMMHDGTPTATAPAMIPTTGSTATSLLWLAAALGLVAIGTGYAIRRRTR